MGYRRAALGVDSLCTFLCTLAGVTVTIKLPRLRDFRGSHRSSKNFHILPGLARFLSCNAEASAIKHPKATHGGFGRQWNCCMFYSDDLSMLSVV